MLKKSKAILSMILIVVLVLSASVISIASSNDEVTVTNVEFIEKANDPGKIYAEAFVRYIGSEEKNVALIAAVYDAGGLKEAKKASGVNTVLRTPAITVSQGETVRAFVWDMDTKEPVSYVATYGDEARFTEILNAMEITIDGKSFEEYVGTSFNPAVTSYNVNVTQDIDYPSVEVKLSDNGASATVLPDSANNKINILVEYGKTTHSEELMYGSKDHATHPVSEQDNAYKTVQSKAYSKTYTINFVLDENKPALSDVTVGAAGSYTFAKYLKTMYTASFGTGATPENPVEVAFDMASWPAQSMIVVTPIDTTLKADGLEIEEVLVLPNGVIVADNTTNSYKGVCEQVALNAVNMYEVNATTGAETRKLQLNVIEDLKAFSTTSKSIGSTPWSYFNNETYGANSGYLRVDNIPVEDHKGSIAFIGPYGSLAPSASNKMRVKFTTKTPVNVSVYTANSDALLAAENSGWTTTTHTTGMRFITNPNISILALSKYIKSGLVTVDDVVWSSANNSVVLKYEAWEKLGTNKVTSCTIASGKTTTFTYGGTTYDLANYKNRGTYTGMNADNYKEFIQASLGIWPNTVDLSLIRNLKINGGASSDIKKFAVAYDIALNNGTTVYNYSITSERPAYGTQPWVGLVYDYVDFLYGAETVQNLWTQKALGYEMYTFTVAEDADVYVSVRQAASASPATYKAALEKAGLNNEAAKWQATSGSSRPYVSFAPGASVTMVAANNNISVLRLSKGETCTIYGLGDHFVMCVKPVK